MHISLMDGCTGGNKAGKGDREWEWGGSFLFYEKGQQRPI